MCREVQGEAIVLSGRPLASGWVHTVTHGSQEETQDFVSVVFLLISHKMALDEKLQDDQRDMYQTIHQIAVETYHSKPQEENSVGSIIWEA